MNELFIYNKLKYRHILKKANILFGENCQRLIYKTVFAKKENTYTISIDKNSIRICYWDDNSENGNNAKNLIKKFLADIFSDQTICVSRSEKCDILNDLHNIKTIQLM